MYSFHQKKIHSETCWTSHAGLYRKHKGQAIAHKRYIFVVVWLQQQSTFKTVLYSG